MERDKFVPITVKYYGEPTGCGLSRRRSSRIIFDFSFEGIIPVGQIKRSECCHFRDDQDDLQSRGNCDLRGVPMRYEFCRPGSEGCKPSLVRQASSPEEYRALKEQFSDVSFLLGI